MRCFGTLPEQCAECTHFLQFPGGIGSPMDVAKAIQEAWAYPLAQMADNVIAEGVTLQRHQPGPGPLLHIRFDPTTSGSVPGSIQPTAVAVEVLRRTGIPGKQNQGRLFIPWLTTSANDADHPNQLSEAAANGMDNAMEAFKATLGGANTRGVLCYPVVYSYRSAAGGIHWAYITRYDTLRPYRALTKRGRRKRPCPPFEEDPTGNRIATNAQGFFYGSPATLVEDDEVWHAIRSLSSCYATVETDGSVFSLPTFDPTPWHGANQLSTVGETETNNCNPTLPSWDWPPLIFTDFADSTFDLALCFGPGRQTAACDVGPGFSLMQGGEFLCLRRKWWQMEGELVMALMKVNADDAYEVWINGMIVDSRPFVIQNAFYYQEPNVVDVTAYIVPGVDNCVGIKCWFAGPNQAGNRIGPCDVIGHTPTWPDFRHGWAAMEIRMWNTPGE